MRARRPMKEALVVVAGGGGGDRGLQAVAIGANLGKIDANHESVCSARNFFVTPNASSKKGLVV